MRFLIFVNGKPRAGKDTVVALLEKALHQKMILTHAMSSIDDVRNMLRMNGFNVDLKSPKERDLLAEVGDAVEKYNGFKTSKCAMKSLAILEDDYRAVFVHMREPALISRTKTMVTDVNPMVRPVTIFVDRPDAENVTSNSADAGVAGMVYDYTIRNDGTLFELAAACNELVKTLVQGGTHERTQPAAG